ncbi:DUF6569 family protein [Homoserinimonas sp. OAct 916]|uniref:ARPP-1 family domain-containing protein n=1 Tax=Homoserinimonas sp. OAct 916 TaxID=2211450 RepID=UPI000DBE0342|nr:DUF6569 family protein [Homoserinimonas sp. OAct 916]
MTQELPQLHVGHGTHIGALSVFPVWIDAPRVTGIGWDAGSLRIDEREGSPVVGELVLTNSVPRPTVALEGDLLRGGWQDRMLASSILLAPGDARVVDVFCVEQGRWHGGSFGAHRAQGRRSAMSVRHGNASGSGQGEVWRRIGRYETALGRTDSSSMLDHLDRNGPIQLRRLEGQRGVIIGISGRVVGAELFGSTSGLRARWQGIVDAAALDARLAQPIRTQAERARSFARHLMATTLEDGGDAGLARHIRSGSGRLRASGIAVGRDDLFPAADFERIIHLTVFDNAHPLLVDA